jgi:hypothetical protein
MVVASQAKVDGLINVGGISRSGVNYVKDVDAMLVKNVTQAMNKLGAKLALKLSENAPSDTGAMEGAFNFLGVKETKTGYRIEIKVGVDYADYIDKGVRGIQNRRKTYPNAEGKFYQYKTYGMPPEALQKLQGWMERKNMEVKATNLRIKSGQEESMAGRQMLPQISTSAKRLAYYIKKYGIEGRQFIKKSIQDVTPDFQVDLRTIGSDTLILKVSK